MEGGDLRILLVDDDRAILQSIERVLRVAGFSQVLAFTDGAAALDGIAGVPIDLALLDLVMPGWSGEQLFDRLKVERPEIAVLFCTGVNEVDTALRLIRAGARDYLVKPVERDRLVRAVRQVAELRAALREAAALREKFLGGRLERPEVFAELAGGGPAMQAIFRYIETIAHTTHPILVTGETGVGKELIARAIHRASGRPGPFVAVNAAGLDDTLFCDTLFGHVRGAFTGADEARSGLVETADGGTLFLDEIGDLPVATQTRLLRFIQEREYYPVGADRPRRSGACLVAATNRAPAELADPARFRRDLFFRLKSHAVHLPPLRERREELPDLVARFVDAAAREFAKRPPTVPPGLFELLGSHDFPGNVRELKAMVYDAVSRHATGVLSTEPFRAAIFGRAEDPAAPAGPGSVTFGERLPNLAEAETALVDEALRRSAGNQSVAARWLGITRQALNRRVNAKRPGPPKSG